MSPEQISLFRAAVEAFLDVCRRNGRPLAHALREVVYALVKVRAEFGIDDAEWLAREAGRVAAGAGGSGVGLVDEALYSHACEHRNTSACKSFESYVGRKPFWFHPLDQKSLRRAAIGTHLHLKEPNPKAPGAVPVWRRYVVSSFNDEKGRINLQPAPGRDEGTRPRVAMDHADFVAMFAPNGPDQAENTSENEEMAQ